MPRSPDPVPKPNWDPSPTGQGIQGFQISKSWHFTTEGSEGGLVLGQELLHALLGLQFATLAHPVRDVHDQVDLGCEFILFGILPDVLATRRCWLIPVRIRALLEVLTSRKSALQHAWLPALVYRFSLNPRPRTALDLQPWEPELSTSPHL